ncbi:MAG: PD40 domain-containing protein [Acidobacteria bacterium]|nr:PD40 domain-containing protein [Acidobacteriota bacterium]
MIHRSCINDYGGRENNRMVTWSPDGRFVIISSNRRDPASMEACLVEVTSGEVYPVIEVLASRDDAELQGFEVDRQGTTAALIWNVAGLSELQLFDLAGSQRLPAVRLPAEIGGGLAFSRDGRRLAIVASGAAAPQDILVHDRGTSGLRQVTRSPHAGVDLTKLVRPQLVRFRKTPNRIRSAVAIVRWFARYLKGAE